MKHLIYIICLGGLAFGCSNSGGLDASESPINPDGSTKSDEPIEFNLVFPHENSLCNEGTNLTATESTVLFEWDDLEEAESYTLFVENLLTGVIVEVETTSSKAPIVILRGTPYAWKVEATPKFVFEIENSPVWKFYNAGAGTEKYVPFPAVLNAPSMAAVISLTNVTLQWEGSDLDNDIVGYDVYLSTDKEPTLYQEGITNNEQNASVVSGSIYYWKVVTKDAEGNTSHSDVFQFEVL